MPLSAESSHWHQIGLFNDVQLGEMKEGGKGERKGGREEEKRERREGGGRWYLL